DPQEISPADFVDQDKGVTLTAQGLEAGEEAEFSVAAAGSDVVSLTEVVTADENGVAQWNVYGLDDSNPSAYLGEYDVTATNESDETVSGSFTVTDAAGDDGDAGEDDSDNGDDRDDEGGSDLPRTGMELGGLAAGAALLTIGGATVLLSRRRATKA
ncbi:MAG TPA: hemagglutinin, partial [Brevibacterium sp.]|nr:hemagglutinin [Brevibacterium sp.]